MPTYERAGRFPDDWQRLTADQQQAFRRAVTRFVEDLRPGRRLRKGLRVKGVRGERGLYEMTWAPDGRATLEYGDELVPGEPHIIWRGIGTHSIIGPR